MTTITLDTRHFDKLASAIQKAGNGDEVRKKASDKLTLLAADLQKTAMQKSPVDLGYLKGSHEIVRSSPATLRSEVIPRAEYAAAVHEPGKKRTYAGKPWLQETLDESDSAIDEALDALADDIINSLF